jgi:hypothetical protein
MIFRKAFEATVVGQHGTDRQVEIPVERQDVVVQHRDRGLRLLGDVQEAEGVRTEGVDDTVQVDLAHALEVADEEGVGTEQLAGGLALDVALAKAGLSFSRKAACSAVSSIGCSALRRSSASQRS